MLLLHQALNDLDIAVAAVPKPVKTAISAELATEVRALRDELAEYSEAIEPPDYEKRRFWESDAPFTVSGDSVSGLSQEDRRTLDALERDLSQADLERAAADLRLLHDAYQKCSNEEARLLIEGFEISDDPYDEEEELYFLNVQAPMPDGKWDRTNWNIELCRWVSDGPDSNSAKGEPLLDCGRAEPPSLAEIVGLLNASNGQTDVLADWAKTPVGEALAGTAFVVTKRYEV